jgi:hypothetical protein
MARSKKDKVIVEVDVVSVEQPKTYKVEFISDLYSMSWGYRKGTIIELDYATYIIAQKYNSIKDL